MPKEPLVSAIVLTHNQERYVAETLDSVLSQRTNFPFELIVGEDCSTDGTRAIVEDYARRNPEIIRPMFREKNLGLLGNLRNCEEATRGKYIAYCGGDDLWHDPSKLQKQVDLLEDHPDVGLIHCDYLTRVGGTNLVSEAKRQRKTVPDGWVYEELLRWNFICASTACWRTEYRRLFAQSAFNSAPYRMEDYPRWLFASRLGKVKGIDQTLATYRIVKGSIMNSTAENMARFWVSCRQVKRDFATAYGCSAEVADEFERWTNDLILKCALYAGNQELFREEYRRMLEINPSWIQPPKRRFALMLHRLRLNWLFRLHESLLELQSRVSFSPDVVAR